MSIRGFVEYREGSTRLLVPELSLTREPPEMQPAFFNKRGRVVRDVSVLAYEAFGRDRDPPAVMADPLAGVGSRSLRVAVECPSITRVLINDLNPAAVKAGLKSAQLNGVSRKVSFTTKDANLFLAELAERDSRVDIVDVDPFGTPAPFVESAIRAVKDGGVVSLTATDTAPLSGLYHEVAYRKYGAHPLRTDYSREVGLRLLLGLLVHRALVYDMWAQPLFCHADQHYMRVYASLHISPSYANDSLKKLGYILHCFKCDYRESSCYVKVACPRCGGKLKAGGPLWTSDLHDAAFLRRMMELAKGPFRRYLQLFKRAEGELGLPPYYYKVPYFTDALGLPSLSPAVLAQRLIERGFKAAPACVDPQGLKTDASLDDFLSCLKRDQPLNPKQTK
jgi:tRNA (guanine26-N2/guanine27-N2)-dimethyltransferase